MAKSENNEVMYGARGKVGNLVVFKNYYGQTVIAKARRKQKNPTSTRMQQLFKERFKEGVIYAKGVLQDPVLTGFYSPYVKDGVRVYNLALADFCKMPEIKGIDTTNYLGNIGDELTIRATDNFKVQSVTVSITSANGTLIETGQAIQAANALDWVYTTAVANPNPTGTIVTAKASDLPGNQTTASQPVQ